MDSFFYALTFSSEHARGGLRFARVANAKWAVSKLAFLPPLPIGRLRA